MITQKGYRKSIKAVETAIERAKGKLYMIEAVFGNDSREYKVAYSIYAEIRNSEDELNCNLCRVSVKPEIKK
jgi:hypothetical protein